MDSFWPSPYGWHSWSSRPDGCGFWFPNMITTQIRKKKKTCAHLRISEKIGFPHVCFYKHSIPLISRSILLCWWGPPPDRPIFRPRHALRLLAGKRQGKGRIQESFNHYPQVSPLKMVNEWEYWWDVYIYNLPFSSNVASWEKNRTAGGCSIAAFDYHRVGDLYNMYWMVIDIDWICIVQ